MHLPDLSAPTLGDPLKDRLEPGHPLMSGTSGFGPVDVTEASAKARRVVED
ncbi:hypothetical protein [Arthrobacter pityocampae]|uniref:hypothetical protein n=1 Tax=Arthrobacter pityocampae TaxID=547334 RepID=UPI003735C0B0